MDDEEREMLWLTLRGQCSAYHRHKGSPRIIMLNKDDFLVAYNNWTQIKDNQPWLQRLLKLLRRLLRP